MAVVSSRGPNSFYSPTNPPPDDANRLALTAYNPLTFLKTGAGFGSPSTAGATRVGYDDTRLTYRGASEFTVGAVYPDTILYHSASLYPHTRGSQTTWCVEFFTDAPWFEFQFKYMSTTQAFRLVVDGRRVTEKPILTSGAGAAPGFEINARFDFGSSEPRRILLEFNDVPFNGIFVPSTASVWKVPAYTDRTLVLGDSISGGSTQNQGLGIGTWVHRVAVLRGWGDVWNEPLSGTGYITAGSFVTFGARATGTVTGSTGGLNDIGQYGLASGTTRVIIWGGYNDNAGTQATISTAAATLYQNIKAALPAAQIYVIGCWSPLGTTPASITATDNTLQAAAAAAGLPFISPITGSVYNSRGTVIATQGQWITPTNQASLVSSDAVHPNDDGYVYISRRISSALDAIDGATTTVEPWAGGLHAALDDGKPDSLKEWDYLFGPSTLATLTPTALTTSAARCWSYNCQFPITVNRLRWYGIGATTTHQVAVYRQSDGVRVIGPLTLTTTADAWNSIAVPAVVLASHTPYIVAVSTTATGTTAGLRTGGTPLLFPPLQASTPGGLALSVGDHRFWFGQFAVTTGAMPTTLPTLVRGSAWTAGLPLFFFDSNSAA